MKKEYLEICFDLEKIDRENEEEILVGYYVMDNSEKLNEEKLKLEKFEEIINQKLEYYTKIKLYHFGPADYDRILEKWYGDKILDKLKFIDIQKEIKNFIKENSCNGEKFQETKNRNTALVLGIDVYNEKLHNPNYDSYISAKAYKKFNELKTEYNKNILTSHLHLSRIIYEKIVINKHKEKEIGKQESKYCEINKNFNSLSIIEFDIVKKDGKKEFHNISIEELTIDGSKDKKIYTKLDDIDLNKIKDTYLIFKGDNKKRTYLGDYFLQENGYFLEVDMALIGFMKQIYSNIDRESIIKFRDEYLSELDPKLIKDKIILRFIEILTKMK